MNTYMTRRHLLELGAASALGALVAACGGGGATTGGQPSAGAVRRGGTVVFPTTFDVRTLDPAFSAQYSERFVYYAVYDSLVRYDKDFNIVPGLARSWKLSSDGTEITFQLQPNVKFHDGADCDAEAVKWNLDRLLDPATNSPLRSQLTPPLQSVTALSTTSVRLKLSTPWRPLLASLGERPGFIVSPTAVQKYGKDYGAHAVGSGPFMVSSYTPGSGITLNRFPGYWKKGEPYLDSVQMVNATDVTVQLTKLRSGEAHVAANLDPKLASTIQGTTGVDVVSRRSGNWYISSVSENRPPFDNPDLRKAMASASDRQAVQKAVFLGQARVASNPIGDGWAYDGAMKPAYPYDLSKARDYVRKAGAQGMSIPFTNSSSSQPQAVAQVLLTGYSKVGVNVQFQTVPGEDFFPEVKAGKIIWSVGNWTPRADPDGLLRILFYSTGFQNTTGYKNSKVDQMLDSAAQQFDLKKAAAMYHDVVRTIEADANTVSVVWPNSILARRSELQGVTSYPDGILRFGDMWLTSTK